MATQRNKRNDIMPLQLDGKGFEGVEVYLTKEEVEYAQKLILEGNVKLSYIKVYGQEAYDKKPTQCYNIQKIGDFRLYMNWFKSKLGEELVVNTDIILKRIAVALHTDPNDIITVDGKIKNLKDIPELARANLEIKWKVDKDGEVVSADIKMMTYKDVLEGLLKMSTVDNQLVKTLVAKIAAPEVKVTKQ